MSHILKCDSSGSTGATQVAGGHVGVPTGMAATGFGTVALSGGTVHIGSAESTAAQEAATAAFTDAMGREGATPLAGEIKQGSLHRAGRQGTARCVYRRPDYRC